MHFLLVVLQSAQFFTEASDGFQLSRHLFFHLLNFLSNEASDINKNIFISDKKVRQQCNDERNRFNDRTTQKLNRYTAVYIGNVYVIPLFLEQLQSSYHRAVWQSSPMCRVTSIVTPITWLQLQVLKLKLISKYISKIEKLLPVVHRKSFF